MIHRCHELYNMRVIYNLLYTHFCHLCRVGKQLIFALVVGKGYESSGKKSEGKKDVGHL